MAAPTPNTARLPAYVYLYFACQSISLTAAVLSVTVGAVAGAALAPSAIWATVPYGLQFLTILFTTYPASVFMARFGRRAGFVLGAGFLAAAGMLGYLALMRDAFILLIAAHMAIGAFSALANFYRFAATDSLVDDGAKARAVSLVIAGGVVAGILGPVIAMLLGDVAGFPKFALCYGFLLVLALGNGALIYALPKRATNTAHDAEKRNETRQPLRTVIAKLTDAPRFYIAVASAALGYGLMNLMMIQATLHMNDIHVPFHQSALAIQWHVVAMFAPSFFTGHLIKRVGHAAILKLGFALFVVSFTVNIAWDAYAALATALILLGVAWNFSYVGGSALLTAAIADSTHKERLQGVCDTTIALLATLGAMLPSILFVMVGWDMSNAVSLVVAVAALGLVMRFVRAAPRQA